MRSKANAVQVSNAAGSATLNRSIIVAFWFDSLKL